MPTKLLNLARFLILGYLFGNVIVVIGRRLSLFDGSKLFVVKSAANANELIVFSSC